MRFLESSKKGLLLSGLAVSLTFGVLAGCGDGVDQDNGISDGQQKDQVDNDTKSEAKQKLDEAKQNVKDAVNNVEKKLQDNNNKNDGQVNNDL